MASAHIFSDSQESLFGSEVFDDLQTLHKDLYLGDINISNLGFMTEQKSDLKIEMQQPLLYQNQNPIMINHNMVQNYPCNAVPVQNLIPIQMPKDIVKTEEIPTGQEIPGPFHFELQLVPQPNTRHWVYSEPLQKVFIDMEKTLPLRFKWTGEAAGLWLRTTMVFCHDQNRNEPVLRCRNHMAPENKCNLSIDTKQIKHVVRCTNSASFYEENDNGHLSVLTPLESPQKGCDYVQKNFQFFCKNSCISGMNRRPTELIFTLENRESAFLGRRKLLVRVCSCPKRDKEKEENEISGRKKVAPSEKRQTSKKRKLHCPSGKEMVLKSEDRDVFHLSFEVPGKDNCLDVLQYTYNLLGGQGIYSGNHELNKPYMDALLQQMQHY